MIRFWYSASDARDTPRHTLTRALEAPGISNSMILVPLFDSKFLTWFAAGWGRNFRSAARAYDWNSGRAGPTVGVRQCLSLQGRKSLRWRRFSPPFAES